MAGSIEKGRATARLSTIATEMNFPVAQKSSDTVKMDSPSATSNTVTPIYSTTTTVPKFGIITLSHSSTLRLLNFTPSIHTSLESVLTEGWTPGIKSAKQLHDTKGDGSPSDYEFSLREKPWGIFGAVSSAYSHCLMVRVLQHLFKEGWVLVTPISPSTRPEACDMLLFRHVSSTTPNPLQSHLATGVAAGSMDEVKIMAVQMSTHAKMYVHGASQEEISAFRELLTKLGFLEAHSPFHDSYGFKLTGITWYKVSQRALRMKRLMIDVAALMDGLGWATYGAIRQRTGSKDVRVPDSWYFLKRSSLV